MSATEKLKMEKFMEKENVPVGDQAAKADAGKLRLSLVPFQIVRDVAEVREYGCRKYRDPENWKKVEFRRYVDAMLRHTLAFIEDPTGVDEESGIPHYKHAECNWAFISEMMKVALDDARAWSLYDCKGSAHEGEQELHGADD